MVTGSPGGVVLSRDGSKDTDFQTRLERQGPLSPSMGRGPGEGEVRWAGPDSSFLELRNVFLGREVGSGGTEVGIVVTSGPTRTPTKD